jgi:hypothetical protein
VIASIVAVLALMPVPTGNEPSAVRLLRRAAASRRDALPRPVGQQATGDLRLLRARRRAVRRRLAGRAARLRLWLGASAGAIAWIARIVSPGSAAWWIAPLLTVGLSLLRTTVDRPAQVEALVGLPLLVLLLLVLLEPASAAGRRLRWIAAARWSASSPRSSWCWRRSRRC